MAVADFLSRSHGEGGGGGGPKSGGGGMWGGVVYQLQERAVEGAWQSSAR